MSNNLFTTAQTYIKSHPDMKSYRAQAERALDYIVLCESLKLTNCQGIDFYYPAKEADDFYSIIIMVRSLFVAYKSSISKEMGEAILVGEIIHDLEKEINPETHQDQLATNLRDCLRRIQSWLDKYPLHKEGEQSIAASNLCKGLVIALKITQAEPYFKMLSTLDDVDLEKTLGVKPSLLCENIQALSQAVEKIYKSLPHSEETKTDDAMADNTPDEQNPSFAKLLNDYYTRILSNEFDVDALKRALQQNTLSIKAVYGARQDLEKLTNNLERISALGSVIEKNRDKKSLSDILKNSTIEYESFKRLIKGDSKERWDEQYKNLTEPTLISSVFSLLSGAAAYPIQLYKDYVPQSVQDTVSSYLPKTLDEESKELLGSLISNIETELNTQIEEQNNLIQEKVREMLDAIPLPEEEKENAILRYIDQLKITPLKELKQIEKATIAANKVAQQFEELMNNYRLYAAQRQQVAGLEKDISSFEHSLAFFDKFFVAISNFLAKYIHSFFKTNLAEQIDTLNTLKKDLAELNNKLSEEMEKITSQIDLQNHLDTELKSTFIASLEPDEPKESPESPKLKNATRNMLFGQIKGKGNKLLNKQPATPTTVEETEEETPMRPNATQ